MARPKTAAATYKKIMLRLPVAMLEAYRLCADREHRSLNAQIVHELECCQKQCRSDTQEPAPSAP